MMSREEKVLGQKRLGTTALLWDECFRRIKMMIMILICLQHSLGC